MSRSVSTISDELRRNKVNKKYDPQKAHHKAYVRRKYARYQGQKIVEHHQLRQVVEDFLTDDQSPEAVAGHLKNRQKKLPYVSKTSIYEYIKTPYGRRVEHYREKRRKRRRRGVPHTKPWHNRKFINERPQAINARKYVGDAEGDFIVSGKSGQGVLLVIVDRKLRPVFLEQILQPTTSAVTRACRRIKQRYPEWKSLTTDNDILFQHHVGLEKSLGIKIYFCFPGHAWEKAQVENTNKYIRRDIPKRSDISRYSKRFIRSLEAKLNRRMLKVLNYHTPQELFDQYRKLKQRRGR